MSQLFCHSCSHPLEKADKFCPGCGKEVSLVETDSRKTAKTIVSSGNYSGTMTKSKTSRGWKIFRNIILVIIILGIVALVVWFQVDPEAGKKLTDALLGIGFMAVFFFVGWLFMRGQKGKRSSSWDDDQYHDVSDDNDFDGDDD